MLFTWFNSGKNNDEYLQRLSPFRSFSFAESTRKTVQDRWKINLQISQSDPGIVQFKIPAFRPTESIVAPTHTVNVQCRITSGACDLSTCPGDRDIFYKELIFDYNDTLIEEQTISMKLPTAKGTLIVTGISLQYSVSKNGDVQYNTNKAYLPAGIVHALYI
jgi:hypothetical protein